MADLAFLQHRLECVDNPEESRAGWHAFLHSRFWHISFYRRTVAPWWHAIRMEGAKDYCAVIARKLETVLFPFGITSVLFYMVLVYTITQCVDGIDVICLKKLPE